jgi:hypothetical protein
MGRIGLRIAGLGALVALTSLAAAAVGQTPPPAEPRKDKKELREDRKEIREDRKELRDAAKAGDKEAAKDAREELKEDKKELREDQKAKLEELRKTRQDRRKDRVKEIRDKWGDAANKPNARAEIRTHARRMARLNHAKTLATSAGKAEIIARIDKLIERENTRHQAAMERLKAEGGKP